MLIDESSAGVGAEACNSSLDLFMCDAKRLHRGNVRRHPILPDLAADGDDLSDAGNGEQPRPDHEIGDLAHVHRRRLAVRGERDQHDLAHDGGDRAHSWIHGCRQLLADQREAFRNELARPVDIDAPIEFDVNHRKPYAGD